MKLTLPLVALIVAAPTLAGPPLICHPFDTGNDSSLPWGTGRTSWNDPDPRYDTRTLAGDTIKLLAENPPLLARMETMRRAAVYAGINPQAGLELAMQLLGRALSTELRGANDSFALFDAGYFVESMKQYVHRTKLEAFSSIDGYQWVKRSLPGLQDKLAAEYALGLMKMNGTSPNEHMRRAIAGAQDGTLLAKNITRYFDQSLADLKRSLNLKSASR